MTRYANAIAWMVVAAATLPWASLVDAAETQRFSGVARDLKTNRVVYTENYEVQVDNGRWISGVTRYFLPNGTAIGERKFDFSHDRYVPLYELDQTNTEYREGITRIDGGKVDVFMVRDGERHAAGLSRVKEMVADCGSQPYLVDHLDRLAAGEMLHFTLAVPGKTDSYRLRASKVGDVDVSGKRAMRIRIELDSVLRLLLPQLELVIDPETKRTLEYSGVTNIKDPATRKSYQARINFSYK